jgi:uncharacterized protein YdiU (UPF0061 family)
MNAPESVVPALVAATVAPAASTDRPAPACEPAAFDPGLPLLPGFQALGDGFFARVAGTPRPDPHLALVNRSLADELGLAPEALAHPSMTAILAGNTPWPGADSIATVYSGHQFGAWAGRLGDGRALLLAQVRAPDGGAWEIQLKGAGKTPFSRMGDGRAVLRSSIREYLCSEAMHGLGIPTTRALALVTSDAPVLRETLETAAVVTRVAPTFVRFGHFEHFYWNRQHDALRRLADHVIDTGYPALRAEPNPYWSLLQAVSERTGALIAQWQSVGFCHGVMNTDNMSILGLTIDYGPFGFLDGFDPSHVCNHSDDQGRYAYSMQPGIGEWNCYCLGQALLPLIGEPADAERALAAYRPAFEARYRELMRAKLGLCSAAEGDAALADQLLAILEAGGVDFTAFFRALGQLRRADASGDAAARDLFIDRAAFDAWAVRYRERLAVEAIEDPIRQAAMNRVNPKFVLRNHLAEIAIRGARDASPPDFTEMHRLLEVLQHPFDEHPDHQTLAALPPDWAGSLSVSCSS